MTMHLDQSEHESSAFIEITEKMEAEDIPYECVNTFLRHYAKAKAGYNCCLPERNIVPVSPAELDSLEDLGCVYRSIGKMSLSQVAVIKLNGGLGTSMGLEGPKSLLPVREGQTFLDIILAQMCVLRETHEVALPLLYMNSFSTH